MAHAPSDALSRRHKAVRRAMADRGLDALVVTSLPNILYLTNFTGSSAIAVLTAATLTFVTDARYTEVLEQSRATSHACPGMKMIRVEASYDSTLIEVLNTWPSARIGFEAQHVSVARHAWLAAHLGTGQADRSLVATEGIVERARIVKDDYELGVLREAGARLSDAARAVLLSVRAGQRERDVALAIDTEVRRAGFERAAFETIVASGPNAALPHARPGERMLSESDLVVLDFGGVYDSYCVDLTRTVSIGRAGAREGRVYTAVLDAHQHAVAAVQPGLSRFDVDRAARDRLAAAGMADAFGHGTGHGLGIEVHEDPRIGIRRPGVDVRDEALEEGMVFTIEPGAYFPGWGGVRIEDDVVVTATGVALLTDVSRELLEL